jgi:hypothetical protein
MSSVLPKNLQNVLVSNMTTASSIVTPLISTGNLYSNSATIPTIMMTGNLYATHTNNTIANIFTTFGNVGIATTSPGARLDVSGTLRATTSITTGALYSTNITSTNITGTIISSGTFNGTTLSTANIYGSSGTISNLVGVNLSSNNLTTTTATIPNIINTNITTNSLFITSGGLIGTFNSNTLGNIFTTSGNVGVNTTSPSYRFDVNGNFRATSGDVTLGNLNVTSLITASNISTSLITVGTLQSTNINNTLLNATGNSNTIGNLFTTAGNVGIGTGIAPERLTVSGSMLVTNGNIQISNGLYTRNSIIIEQYGSNFLVSSPTTGSNVTILQNTGGGGLSLQPGGGNIGIGTTSASVKLQVEDGSIIIGDSAYVSTSVPSAPGTLTTANGYRLFFDNSHNGTAGIGIPANKIVLHNNNFVAGFGVESASVTYHSGYSHTFYGNATNTSTYGNSTMMIRGDGNVGIATTNPQTTLHINGPGLQMGISTNAFHLFNTRASLYLLTGSSGAGTNVAAFTSTGNVGIGTTAPIFTLDTPGTIRASTGMLISGNSTLEFGHNISGKEANAGRIGYNSFAATGLTLVGAGTVAGNRLVYIYDHLQVSDSITVGNLRTTSTLNAAGNATIQNSTNNYTLTSGSLNVTGDIVLSGTELMFTTTSIGAPTMNGRSAGTKMVLYPATGTGSGDYAIGIENLNMWFQVPILTSGYKFYQGTSANFVIANNGNVGIGTTAPATKLHVDGNLLLPLGSRLATASITDNFIYSGATVGQYSLLWNNDTADAGGAMSYISGFGGLRIFSNGTPRLNLTRVGNFGIGTTSPAFTLDVANTTRLQNDLGVTANSGAWNTTLTKGLYMRYSTNASQDSGYIQSIDKSSDIWHSLSIQARQLTFNTNGGDGSERMIITSTGNVGINTTTPIAKLHVVGNAGTNNIFEGTDHTYLQLYPFGLSAGRKAWIGFGGANDKNFTINNEATSGNIILNNVAGGAIQFSNNNTTAVTITGGNVGIGTATPAYLLDVNGTIDALTVTTGNLSNGTATIGTLLNTTMINYGLSAQWVINGGGNVTWTGSSVLWNTRVIVIPVKRSEHGSTGHFDINCPTSGTIQFYNSVNVTTTVTCTASGIPIGSWNALYYEITPGQATASDQTKFRLVDFNNSTWKPTSNWLLIAVVNGDNFSLKWIPGNTYIPTGKIFYGDSTNNWQINGTTNYIPKFNAANTLTANSIIFDNGSAIGIGTTAPTTAFSGTITNTKLALKNGNSGDNNGTSVILIGGNSNHYSYIEGAHTNSGSTYLSFGTSNTAVNPTEKMRITAAGDVGIGTASPGTRLNIYNSVDTETSMLVENNNSGTSAYASLRLKTNVASNGYIFLNSSGKTNDGPALCMTMRNDTGDLRLQSAGGNGIYISSTTGNIGIGTSTPASKLHIFEASGTAAGANSGSIILDHDNSGGASSITFRSKVNRGSDYAYIQYQDAATVGGAGEVSKLIIAVQNDTEDHIILDPSGSVGIGTYSPGFKLHVNGNLRADNIYNNGWFRNYGDTGLYNEDYACNFVRNDAQFGNWRMYGNAVGGWNGLRFTQAEITIMAGESSIRRCGFHYNGIGWGLFVDENRNLFVPGNITAYWSDRRLKTNLQQLSHFDDVLTSLTGYSFNWNEKGQEILQKPSDEREIGLIAQDVQAVIPQAVTINKAGQKLDDPEPFEYLTINYDKIIPFLIEGYKSQRSEIHELKSKVQRLEELVQQILDK